MFDPFVIFITVVGLGLAFLVVGAMVAGDGK